jgi:hypothetical protein
MSEPGSPGSEHVSDLAWDRWLAGELDRDQAARAELHAASCARCAARRRELTSERDAFVLRPRLLPAAPVHRTRWWWAAPMVLAAAAATLVLWPRPAPRRLEDGQRKGADATVLTLLGGAAGRLRPLASGDTVRPGDSLQATYHAEAPGYGAVIARDGAGQVSVYVPAEGVRLAALPPGHDAPFPASTVLDAVVGPERVMVVWCPTDHPLATLTAGLAAAGEVALPTGCTGRVLELHKQAAP